MSVGLWDRGTRWSSFRVQAGRGTTVAQFEWLVLRSRAQYICDALGELERFPLAFDLAQDPALPMSTVPVLLLWAKKVIAALGHEREACLQHLRHGWTARPACRGRRSLALPSCGPITSRSGLSVTLSLLTPSLLTMLAL